MHVSAVSNYRTLSAAEQHVIASRFDSNRGFLSKTELTLPGTARLREREKSETACHNTQASRESRESRYNV